MNTSASILVAEDEPSVARALARIVQGLGCAVETAADGRQALALLESRSFDLVLTDLRMGAGPDGMDVLAAARRLSPPPPVIMISAYGTITLAVQAMRRGAYSFIAKPFQIQEVEDAVRDSLGRRARSNGDGALAGAVAEDPKTRAVFQMALQIAPSDATVLIAGETGVGKDVVARVLHEASGRKGPLLAVNCASIPESLLESELFGHARGSFTGAHASQPGRFVLADKGTLFLDEIAEMTPPLQAKLLRVLQERVVWPVGASAPMKVDVRIVAATHQDIEERVRQGLFREDLYYRLAVIPIRVPSLRERRGDIPALLMRYLGEAAGRRGARPLEISPLAMERLCGYHWPGNIRELANLCERLLALKSGGVVEEDDLPESVRAARRAQPAESVDLRGEVERLEWELIDRALAASGGNHAGAARMLGMKRTTLVEKLKRRRTREATAEG